MRNRAKCKVCGSIIESFTVHDYVTCECGEISIDGGQHYLKCSAKNFENFLRLDDEDNEIVVKVKETDEEEEPEEEVVERELSLEEKQRLVDDMLSYYERLPSSAMVQPPTQYDLKAIYLLLKRIL